MSIVHSPRITPFLWFDNNAGQAVEHYLSIFKNSRRLDGIHSDSQTPAEANFSTVSFELDGQKMIALNGGPMFHFNESISFVVRCDNQDEIDDYWARLSAGGSEGRCGWLKDKFGLSWQVVPGRLPELIRHPAALQAMMKMNKLNIAELESAAKSSLEQEGK